MITWRSSCIRQVSHIISAEVFEEVNCNLKFAICLSIWFWAGSLNTSKTRYKKWFNYLIKKLYTSLSCIDSTTLLQTSPSMMYLSLFLNGLWSPVFGQDNNESMNGWTSFLSGSGIVYMTLPVIGSTISFLLAESAFHSPLTRLKPLVLAFKFSGSTVAKAFKIWEKFLWCWLNSLRVFLLSFESSIFN